MAEMSGDGLSEGRLDLVPMIDCIMLLLLFFMLTTKFTPEEKTIQNILPTNSGLVSTPSQSVEKPVLVFVNIYPAGISKDTFNSEQQTDEWVKAAQKDPKFTISGMDSAGVFKTAEFRVGTRPRAEQLEVSYLADRDVGKFSPHIERIHKFIHEELTALEVAGKDRKGQPAVIIQCFSVLSWQFALVAYDAVRAYELQKDPSIKPPFTPEIMGKMRAVNFSPPRLREFKKWELGNELFQILRTTGG